MAIGIIGLEQEVQSGGFDAYFRGSDAWWCADALDGLREIGATRHLAVFKKAVAVLTPGRCLEASHAESASSTP